MEVDYGQGQGLAACRGLKRSGFLVRMNRWAPDRCSFPGVISWSKVESELVRRGISKAPAEVVDAKKAKLAELEGQLAAMTAQMEQLKAL